MLIKIPYQDGHFQNNMDILRGLDTTQLIFVDRGRGPAFSFYYEDKYLGSAGLNFIYEGVCQVWIITSKYVEEYPKEFITATLEQFQEWVEQDIFWRCSAIVPAHLPKFTEYVEMFEFEREGLARKIGPNKEDYYYYAWIRND